MMHGVTAAGKTTTSKYLAQFFKATRLATSQVRAAVGARAAPQGDERRDSAYAEVADRLKVGLRSEGRFVLDGTYALRRWREPVYKICRDFKAPLYVVYCVCDDEDEIHRRIEDRKRRAPKSPDTEADRFFFYVSEKHHFEELLADDFRQGTPEAIIVVDTFGGTVNTVNLASSDSSVALAIGTLWEILGNEPKGHAFDG